MPHNLLTFIYFKENKGNFCIEIDFQPPISLMNQFRGVKREGNSAALDTPRNLICGALDM